MVSKVVEYAFQQLGRWITLEYYQIKDKKEISEVVQKTKTASNREEKLNAARSIGDLGSNR